jgi:hypothetical protein
VATRLIRVFVCKKGNACKGLGWAVDGRTQASNVSGWVHQYTMGKQSGGPAGSAVVGRTHASSVSRWVVVIKGALPPSRATMG